MKRKLSEIEVKAQLRKSYQQVQLELTLIHWLKHLCIVFGKESPNQLLTELIRPIYEQSLTMQHPCNLKIVKSKLLPHVIFKLEGKEKVALLVEDKTIENRALEFLRRCREDDEAKERSRCLNERLGKEETKSH